MFVLERPYRLEGVRRGREGPRQWWAPAPRFKSSLYLAKNPISELTETIHPLDLAIFIAYLIFMLGVGVYFLRKNKSDEDYYVGGRSMSAGHIGLSVVATDVGGGFSIGLGGLGFAMGISGSWMLLTGLIGAWMSAVWLIPKVYPVAAEKGFLTFPQALSHHYNSTVVLLAAAVSFIGYTGFTS